MSLCFSDRSQTCSEAYPASLSSRSHRHHSSIMSSKEFTLLLGLPCLLGIVFLALLYCKVFGKYFTVFDGEDRSVDFEAEVASRTYVINVVLGSQGEEPRFSNQGGSARDLIQSLTCFQYRELTAETSRDSVMPATDCAVCLAQFEEHDFTLRLPLCCHVFHKSCMNAWLLAHNSCPLCRRCILPVSE